MSIELRYNYKLSNLKKNVKKMNKLDVKDMNKRKSILRI